MNEKLLQFIWQYQYINHAGLTTNQGETITVIHPGTLNTNQGPDFLNARLQIGTTTWAGNIEVHVLATDWDKHKHQDDEMYKNVILHIVWKNDALRKYNLPNCPVLEIQQLVPKLMLGKYTQMMEHNGFIPCEKSITTVPAIVFSHFRERLVIERLQHKTKPVQEWLDQTMGHWEETFWRLLARNFGITVNAPAFEGMACNTPILLLARNKHSQLKIESLLMGQCGLLSELFADEYPRLLQQEYRLLKIKYDLTPSPVRVLFLRMRPVSFPTIRLSQLATLVHQSQHLFSKVIETDSLDELKNMFAVGTSDYWLNHYRFDGHSKQADKTLGSDMICNIIINTIIPVLFAYGAEKDHMIYKERALRWMAEMPAEKNSIISGFQKIQVKIKNAAGSQALIHLKNNYCRHKRCLECALGSNLLKKQSKEAN